MTCTIFIVNSNFGLDFLNITRHAANLLHCLIFVVKIIEFVKFFDCFFSITIAYRILLSVLNDIISWN